MAQDRVIVESQDEVRIVRLNRPDKLNALDPDMFDALMETAKVCSLGQISGALYEVGGQYRRNM